MGNGTGGLLLLRLDLSSEKLISAHTPCSVRSTFAWTRGGEGGRGGRGGDHDLTIAPFSSPNLQTH